MKAGTDKYRRNSPRLLGYNYSHEGLYYITILTKNLENFFGTIQNQKISLNAVGELFQYEWEYTEQLRERVTLGEYVIMPNHFHAVIALGPVKAHGHAPLLDRKSYKNKFGPQRNNLSSIIRGFKGSCTKKIRQQYNPSFGWHRSFYDRIIRNTNKLERIEEYIFNNPLAFYLKQKDSGFELNF